MLGPALAYSTESTVRTGNMKKQHLTRIGNLIQRRSTHHRQNTGVFVFQRELFICEFFTINTLATGAVAVCEISALHHETLDDSVESAAFEVQWLSTFAFAFLSRAESAEIFCRFGDDRCVSAIT